MNFLAPWMLWGVGAASIPVALHFFYRSRYRRLPWAAMKFLLTSIEQTSRRLRFQEILLLVVRTLLLALLGLALARPSTLSSAGAGGGDAVDAIFVMDISASMSAREGEHTRLDLAREAALAVMDHLPSHSTVQIVVCADRADNLGPPASSDLDRSRKILKDLEVSHQASDLLPGVMEAALAAARGHSPNKEVYIFSDMQQDAWDHQAEALTARLREIGEESGVYLVRCGTREPTNATLVGIATHSGIPHTGERVGFAVIVRNTGREPVSDITVTLEVEGRTRDHETQAIALLGPGETQAVTLTGRFERPGLRPIRAWISADELKADDQMEQVVHVRRRARILVVDGSPGGRRPEDASAFYLLHSLRPVPEPSWAGYHIQPRSVTPADAEPALLGNTDLCILVNVAIQPRGESDPGAVPYEFLERLSGFVSEGHGLMIFGGPNVSAEDYTELLDEKLGLLPYPLSAPLEADRATPMRLDAGETDPQSFLAPFREEPLNRVNQTGIFQALGVKEENRGTSRVLVRYTNGNPAIASRSVGAGHVILVTTSADESWTDWPLRGHTYLPFLHLNVSHLLGGESRGHNLTAGQEIRWHPPSQKSGEVYVMVDPKNNATGIGAPKMDETQNRFMVTALNTGRAGLYRIAPKSGPNTPPAPDRPDETLALAGIFAVSPDIRETENLSTLSDEQIDKRLDFNVHHLIAGDDPGAFSGAERLKREWTLWLLLAVMILALFEMGLAWYCGRGW